MTTPNTESLLRGFRMTPGAMPTVNLSGVTSMEQATRLRDHIKGARTTTSELTHYEHVRAEPSGPPALTRYNGDGTWKVVRAGETLASNFDSEPEAAQWIADNA
jgi:hypothetical protein